jgi:hypothetical protein
MKAIALTVAVIAGLHSTAHAAQRGGWVWYDGSGTPEAAYTYNSSGGAVSITQAETGLYNVTFAGLASSASSLGGAVATAYGSNANCQTGNIVISGADIDVEVDCWNPTGGQMNSYFSLVYEQRTAWGGKGGNAYVYADQPGSAYGTPYTPGAAEQFNSAGGVNTVTNTGPGLYTFTLPGLSHLGGTVQVDAGDFFDTSNGGFTARCQTTGWGAQSGSTVASVACVDQNNAPASVYVRLIYSIAGLPMNGIAGITGAYAWANEPTETKPYKTNMIYQYNSYTSSALKSQLLKSGVGQYLVTLPAGGSPTSTTVVATAVNNTGDYCNIARWTNTSIYVDCYDGMGVATNSGFNVMFLAKE